MNPGVFFPKWALTREISKDMFLLDLHTAQHMSTDLFTLMTHSPTHVYCPVYPNDTGNQAKTSQNQLPIAKNPRASEAVEAPGERRIFLNG